MSGATVEFSESDLAASAAAYNPAVYRAPIVVGHPRLDAPAYGWVDGLHAASDGLYADASDVDVDFADMVKEGRFPNRSASFFPPTHPRNPVPGVYYLKHIGVLGAAPPAVRGLKPIEFCADDACLTVDFAGGYDDQVNAGLWRRLREWFIGEKGLDIADNIISDYAVQALEAAARQEQAEEVEQPISQYAQGESMTPEEKARLDAAEAESARLKSDLVALQSRSAEFADREASLAAREAEARTAEVVEFAGGLVKAGKVLPRDRAGLVAYLAAIPNGDDIEFAEGDATVTRPAGEWLRAFLVALPVQVDFAEHGADQGDTQTAAAEYAAPDGYDVDLSALDLHRRALAHQQANSGTDYLSAVKAVSNTR